MKDIRAGNVSDDSGVTQCGLVAGYLDRYGSITATEALANLSIQRLSAIIYKLREHGVLIKREMALGRGWSGKTTRHAIYRLEGWSDNA